MKRLIPLLFILALLLCACGGSRQVTHTVNGITYTVDTENGTVTDGTYTYRYETDGSTTTVTYPDGSYYWYTEHDSGSVSTGTFGSSEDYDEDRYVSGDTLANVISRAAESKGNPGNIWAGLLLMALGAFDAIFPHTAWWLSRGWWYRDAEPSDFALGVYRVVGVLGIVAGIIVLITGL